MLARDGVVFFTLKFVGRITFVLHGGVKVAGIGAGNKFDFFTHNITPLYLFATTAYVCQHDINPDFVYHTHTLCGKAQANPAILAFHPEAVSVQVRQKAAPSPVIGMGYIIPAYGAFARDLTYSGHDFSPNESDPAPKVIMRKRLNCNL